MAKHRKRTKEEYDKEIADAVKRIGKRKEAKRSAYDSEVWQDYLLDVLNISPSAVESDAGSNFWEKVRKAVRPEPTQKQLEEANVSEYSNPKTKQRSYRGAGGRFVKLDDIISGKIIGF